MAGQSTVVADEEQRTALAELAKSRERGEADRARCILLTLSGWSSPRLAEAFGVREDTVRLWRMEFMASGVEALRTRVPPGPAPVKALRVLEVAEEVLSAVLMFLLDRHIAPYGNAKYGLVNPFGKLARD